MVISGNVSNAFLSRLSEKFAFFVPISILPRVFDNKRCLRILLAMSSPTDSRPTGNAMCSLHDLVNDEALCFAVSFNVDILLIARCSNGRVKPKHLLVHP
jgi:hypothetical protein